MSDKRKGYLKAPREVALPQEEINLLDRKETSIIEDTKNIFRAMDQAVGVGGASGQAKVNAFKSTYYKGQSENYLLPKEQRDVSFTKSVGYKEGELKNKEEWLHWREEVIKTVENIDNPVMKFVGKMTTGMLGDYADWTNLNQMIAINALTQNFGGGVTKLHLLTTDMLMGGVEEAHLNYETQNFMLEHKDVDYTEVAMSGLYGMIGETIFPMLGSATGMGYGKVMKHFGDETFDEISGRLVKEASDIAKMDVMKSKVKNAKKYAKGNYDKNIITDASKIQSGIDNTGSLTGNLREQGDSIVTVNGKPESELKTTNELIQEWKDNAGTRTLEQEKAILNNIERELQKITKGRTLAEEDIILDAIEKDLKDMQIQKKPRGEMTEAELRADMEGSKEFQGRRGELEADPKVGDDLAVNDIGVDNKKATEELFVPKKLGEERVFNPIPNKSIQESKFMQEIQKETEIFNTKTNETTDAINNISETGEMKPDDIDKINDFIEDYELEETIPLLKTRADGTIDFGKKTKDEFVSDFKIELQLFSSPIDKTTPEAIFKNVTLREATKVVNESKDILRTLLKKGKEKVGRPLKLTERDTLIRNFIKEKLYNSYRYSQNKYMTRLHFNTVFDIDGNRYGAKEIFNLLETDGDKGFLAKALFDGKATTKTKGTGLAMRKFIKRFDDSISLLVEGNFKTDFDNIHNSISFDSKKMYYDSVNEADMIRITNENGDLDFSKLSMEEKAELDVFAFDQFAKKNADLFDKKTAKLVWDNFTMHGKAASQLEGTALHQMGELQRFFDETVIDKGTLRKLTERYTLSDRAIYNKMVKASSNANALYNTFGYKPKNTMNRMFGNYSKSNPLTKKSTWLFGEGSQAWTLKTGTNDYANMIFADEIGRTKGQIPFKAQRFFNYKAKMDSIMLGMTELPVEIGTHMAKRLAVGKESMHQIVFQTVKSVLQMHSLTKKIGKEAESTFLKEHVGALGSLYQFMITKGDTDYSGAIADTLKGMTKKQKAMFKVNRGIGRLNFIQEVDLYGDKLALFGTSYDIDKFGKVGYKEIMSKSKYNYIASKLDEFGIGQDTFDLMVNAKRGEFGIRNYELYTKKELEIRGGTASMEIKKMEDFTSFYASKIGFTKPDVEFAKAKNVFKSNDDKFLSALNMYWKKTMYTKLKDGGSLLSTMNTYGGLGKTFDWVNMDHYVRLMMGATAIGIGGYGSDRMDEIVYGYELEEAETLTEHIMLIFNQFGAYTLTDQTSLMRSLGQVLNGKTVEAKAKGAAKLALPSKVIRQVERVIEEE